MPEKKKILVWLSGWVDSAVSAYLLKQQWFDVVAGFMVNYIADEWEDCTTQKDIAVAKEVAHYLDIPFFTFNYVEEYKKKVLDYMYAWYQKGITPNPDIMCNSEIKFQVFLQEALEAWFDMIATWHYAQIYEDSEGIFHLKKWKDRNKDQSYFLAWLSQLQLSKALFPIGHLEKSEVREIAKKAWLPNALRKDSQGICFVGKVDFLSFLEKKIVPQPGNIVDTNGNILWTHKWVFYYTIGQRKWLDIWWQPKPIFVVKKDIEKNEITVWDESDVELYDDRLFVAKFHFLWKTDFDFPIKAQAKIRYRQADQQVEIFKREDWYEVIFSDKQRAIAPWQICAIYIDDELVMSGVIQ